MRPDPSDPREETLEQRDDRNLIEMLQELRVAGLGVQILFAFLLALPFTTRFVQLHPWQRDLYTGILVVSAVATALLLGPVAYHRLVFRRRQKEHLVRAANVMAIGGLIAVALAVCGTVLLVISYVANGKIGIIIGGCTACLFGGLWFGYPLTRRLRGTAPLTGRHPNLPRTGGGFISYDDDRTREQLTGWVHDNLITRLKIKIGECWGSNERRDRARVALCRDCIGPDAELYVDANGAYRTGQAVRVGGWLADCGVSWFEEPVSSQDLAGLAEVRRHTEMDVAAGEYSWTLADSARLIDAAAVDCLQLDATRCGGITGYLRAAALAEAHSMDVSAHCAPNIHAHVGAAAPALRHIEYFHDHQRIERMLLDGAFGPAGGVLIPDLSAPGHGLTFRDQDAAAYRKC